MEGTQSSTGFIGDPTIYVKQPQGLISITEKTADWCKSCLGIISIPSYCNICWEKFCANTNCPRYWGKHNCKEKIECNNYTETLTWEIEPTQYSTFYAAPYNTLSKVLQEITFESKFNEGKLYEQKQTYFCNQCGEGFEFETNLKSHIRIHECEKPFACYYCNENFRHESILIAHMQTHTGRKQFLCRECKKRFGSRAGLSRHIHICRRENFFIKKILKNQTQIWDDSFNCVKCGRKFKNRGNFVAHMRTHSEKPFKCENKNCGKFFSQLSAWKKHLSQCNKKKTKM